MRALGLALVAFAFAAPVWAQDGGVRDAGRIAEAGTESSAAGTGSGAGAPADEQPEVEEVELPEGHRPEVALTIEPREGLATGDLVHVIVTVRLPEGDDVNVPRQTFGPFEIHDQRHRDRPIEGGRREFTFEIDLLALEPGEHELPALRLRVITADGAVGTVLTEPQRVVVASLIANEPDAQPRPASRPVPVMQDDYTLAWVLGILGAMLLTALATWLVARWWSRRPKVAPPPPPPRPAWETALAKLDALRKKSASMLERGEHVALVDGVSDALREYLGARYDFNGLESTTDEVIERVRGARPAGATLSEITALLGDCDLVKFAKAVPSQQQCDEMIASAVRIVRATMPTAAPAIAPPASAAGLRPVGGEAPRAQEPTQARVARGAPIVLPLAIEKVESVDAVLGAAVNGMVSARAGDPAWDGTIVVRLGEGLPDEYAARMALRAAHESITRSVANKRSGGVRVVIEHAHAGGRKSVYGPGIGQETREAEAGSGATARSGAEPGREQMVTFGGGGPTGSGSSADEASPPVSGEPRHTATGNAFDDEKEGGQ